MVASGRKRGLEGEARRMPDECVDRLMVSRGGLLFGDPGGGLRACRGRACSGVLR